MKEIGDSDKRALKQCPEFRSLLDQLDTKIEHDLAGLGDLNTLSLRLFALHRQRDRLGRNPISSEREQITPEATTHSTPAVSSETEIGELRPSSLSQAVSNNKFKFWLSRRRRS